MASPYLIHFEYNRWATQRVLDEIGDIPAEQLHKDLKNIARQPVGDGGFIFFKATTSGFPG